MKLKSYLQGFENFTDLPKRGIPVVYCIHIGNKIYIGCSSDLKSRVQIHTNFLNRMTVSTSYINSIYRGFNKNDIKMFGFSFSIVKILESVLEARELERKLILRYFDSKLLLNGRYSKQKKRKTTKFKTLHINTN